MSQKSYQRRRVNRRNQLLIVIAALVVIALTWLIPGQFPEATPVLQSQLATVVKVIITGIFAVIALFKGFQLVRYVLAYGFRNF